MISLICTDGDRLEKEMRCVHRVKETDMWDDWGLAGEEIHPGNIRQTGWFGEVNT